MKKYIMEKCNKCSLSMQSVAFQNNAAMIILQFNDVDKIPNVSK